MNWSTKLQEWISMIVARLTRSRHASRGLLLAGAMIVVATLGSGFRIGVRGSLGPMNVLGFIESTDGIPAQWVIAAFALGATLLLLGAGMSWFDWFAAKSDANRRAVIVIELRGLVDTSTSPLLRSVPRKLKGQRLDALVDVRVLTQAGAIDRAARSVLDIPDLIRRLRGSRELGHVTLVVGGILQVPLLFLAGVLLDDEGPVTSLDWNRSKGAWRMLDEPDDGQRFVTSGLDELKMGEDHVVLSVSASYCTSSQAIDATFGNAPRVSLSLSNPLPDLLWSSAKQDALAEQFVSTVARLGNKGVRRISLVLAAPASLVIRMGRAYDRRNMPRIACFQYEPAPTPAYPWSVGIEPGDVRIVPS